jgi:hypothetical protein
MATCSLFNRLVPIEKVHKKQGKKILGLFLTFVDYAKTSFTDLFAYFVMNTYNAVG